ncbi:MAG: cytochrome C oxidase subunit II [Anaerolineae bacterium]|jgi:cytochrome c oxidase subunit II|nr:cytochrome C oxidase subunit II [Anaerolineae bacterium]MBT7070172.1 cytochrome C oxidase subunit II [Anaerolineae bacterium]MBT7324313.1 cytochrome C oxidase subunit II [Anaerolineae bacterium]
MMHIDRLEKIYIYISIAVLVIFTIAITIAGFALGIQVPSPSQLIDPNTVASTGPYSEPGLRELSPGNYELYIRAEASPWRFYPDEVTVPLNSTVTFHVTSADVQHGFKLQDTNVNFMVLPGQESTLTYTFTEIGDYPYICTEYCGVGHQNMYGVLTVE